jgi:hypothetical protein
MQIVASVVLVVVMRIINQNGKKWQNSKASQKIESFICFTTWVYHSRYTRMISIRLIFVKIWLAVHLDFLVSRWTASHISTNMAPIEISLFFLETLYDLLNHTKDSIFWDAFSFLPFSPFRPSQNGNSDHCWVKVGYNGIDFNFKTTCCKSQLFIGTSHPFWVPLVVE